MQPIHALKSVAPAFVANAVSGVLLFNTFSEIMRRLSNLPHPEQVHDHHHQIFHTAIAGAAAGLVQSFVAAPIDTLTMRTEMDHHVRDWIHQAQQRSIASLWRAFHLTVYERNFTNRFDLVSVSYW